MPAPAQDGVARLSPMALEWQRHALLPFDASPVQPVILASAASTDKPPVTVLGYVTYWTLANTIFHFDQLTEIAYFGAAINADGTIDEAYQWNTQTLDDLITQAHANGIKVVLTVLNFSATSMSSVMNANKTVAIKSIVDLVVAGGGDGVNIDFEGLKATDKAAFVSFMHDLKIAMDEALGESRVTTATPAVDWSGAFDYDELAKACDGLVIMGYAYYWTGGNPGPNSPLIPSDMWGSHALSWTIEDYLTWGTKDIAPEDTVALAERKKKFILALPLYGQNWASTDGNLPGTQSADGTSPIIRSCFTDGADDIGTVVGGWQWDENSQTPYKVYRENGDTGTWHQWFCENSESLYLKYKLAADAGIGGVGFWALGYDRISSEPWDQLVVAFPPAEPLPDVAEEVDSVEVMPDIAEVVDVVEIQPDIAVAEDVTIDISDIGTDDVGFSPITDLSGGKDNVSPSGGGGGCAATTSSSHFGTLLLLAFVGIAVLLRRRRIFL